MLDVVSVNSANLEQIKKLDGQKILVKELNYNEKLQMLA